jgi:hypothetical protein
MAGKGMTGWRGMKVQRYCEVAVAPSPLIPDEIVEWMTDIIGEMMVPAQMANRKWSDEIYDEFEDEGEESLGARRTAAGSLCR